MVTERDFSSGETTSSWRPSYRPISAEWPTCVSKQMQSPVEPDTSNLWMSSLAGSGPPIRLTSDTEKIEQPGSWSHDSAWFVYTVVEDRQSLDDAPKSPNLRQRHFGDPGERRARIGRDSHLVAATGDWILYDDMGLKLLSAGGKAPRALGLRDTVCAFARDADLLHCLPTKAGPGLLVTRDFTGAIVREVGPVDAENAPRTDRHASVAAHADTRRQRCDVQRATVEAIQLLLVEGLDTVALP